MNKQVKLDRFIKKAIKVHGNKFDYSAVDYIDSKHKIKIICKIHGIFEQGPASHIEGYGCRYCNFDSQRHTTKSFIIKSVKRHGLTYNYKLVDYIGCKDKIKIICKIHGIFEQNPNDHLNGAGCRRCSNDANLGNKHGRNNPGCYSKISFAKDLVLANKKATLYLLEHENLHKVGITTNMKNRFSSKVNIIKELKNITLLEAFTLEQEILQKYKKYKQRPINWKSSGKTEFLNLTKLQLNNIIKKYYK